MPYLKVTGGKIWYKILGKKTARIPLIIVHGGPGYPSYYLQNLSALARDRQVIVYDQLGCGRSGKSNEKTRWTVRYFVQELEMLVQRLGFQKFNLLGHSWGSFLALSYALKRQSRVNGLILASPYLSTKLWIATMNHYLKNLPRGWGRIIRQSEQSGHTDTVQYKKAVREFHFRHETRFKRDPQSLRLANKHFNAEIYRYMWGPNEYTITGTLKKADLAGQLKKLKMPVLFTCGKYEAADPATVNKFVRLTPHARMAVFSRSAHMPHLKEPKKYFKTIREFLKCTDYVHE
ncbi:hypothetical protein A3J36_02775 [Candidatus Uhrbacteria bacterium RIFCSPLOWO2_02_FULL_54_37]|uniref:AB hydrolase-1 domain-containing protein n=1 Tax=Candidatus Uhrbacteria bacterium RIFCSPLOWO2_02_FULL_54_37 TaxID=1802412 RepID=A0A1F7VGT8_9BACT|nr:MAG: hypothetical protein A3J36_02775 [Candidatus Uhrbacteria bacterium RIFCSPLOWO2_02_FULL_54_37]